MIIFWLTCLVGYPRTSAPEPKIAKELLEDGIIENVEELTGIKQEENKEDAEQADMNKPGDVDLAYFELRGKVKSFTERNDDNSISYSFTEKGKWNTYNGRSIQPCSSSGPSGTT